MGFGWRRQGDQATTEATTSRWTEAAASVTDRFQRFHELPLDEAVEAALVRAPGNMSRDELARRIAASREVDQPPL
jgi:hypothetical protein